MKKIILLAFAVCSVMLLSFTNSDGSTEKDRVFRIDADGTFHVLKPDVVSIEDMNFIRSEIAGKNECKTEHTSNTCKTEYKEYDSTGKNASKVLAIVEKYNSGL